MPILPADKSKFETPLSKLTMTLPEHLIPVVRRIRGAPTSELPSPWYRTGEFGVGGLTDVGFGRGTDLLLVISSQGRGVFDCVTGVRVARDYDEGDWQDILVLEAEGIGPLAHSQVRTAGLHGGGLSLCTRDGWTAEDFVLDWPDHTLLLVQPGSWAYGDAFGKPAEFTKVAVESETRAWGFSPTGESLILATSSDLTIWNRTTTATRRVASGN